MLKIEKPYEFKEELLKIHKDDIRNYDLKAENDEYEVKNGIMIVLPPKGSDPKAIIHTAAMDFADYLIISMGVSAMVGYVVPEGTECIKLSLSKDIGTANGYMGYSVTVEDNGIDIKGYDEVGVAQALYYLEDLMTLRKAPFLTKGNEKRKAMFTYRTSQSPLGMFEFTNEVLSLMAHRGYDSICLWLKDSATTNRDDFMDVKLICDRAEKYGIKIYACLYQPHNVHPDAEGAQEYYDNLYGKFFGDCPKLCGINLLGEANQFSSRDPEAGKTPWQANYIENIPTGKPSPGFYPCCDYPEWVEMIKNSIRKHNPEADIIVCTYNWGGSKREKLLSVLERLPEDVTIQATWDLFDHYRIGKSVESTADYSLRTVGPAEVFVDQAKLAKRRNMKLYGNCQSSGRTWDFGVIPYEPTPRQWIARYNKMRDAHYDWGLMGTIENIHYGFHPSIINDLEKWAFFEPARDLDEIWQRLLKRDFCENSDKAGKAMELFSDAIEHFSLTNEDQYGAFRIGPSYPIWTKEVGEGKKPPNRRAMFGNAIYTAMYAADTAGKNSMPGVRVFDELEELRIMLGFIAEGIKTLEECENPNDNILRLLNMARFMHNTVVTGIHVKEHYILNNRLKVCETKERASELLDEMEVLFIREKKNVEDTIPLVRLDSRLGWEPSMEYTTDESGLRWKLRQIDYELNITLKQYREANSL